MFAQSFLIPVSVRVWDVNDNAPAWRGAPYRARVSELAAVGARVLPAPAADADQPGPHATVHYSVLPGPYSVSTTEPKYYQKKSFRNESRIFNK